MLRSDRSANSYTTSALRGNALPGSRYEILPANSSAGRKIGMIQNVLLVFSDVFLIRSDIKMIVLFVDNEEIVLIFTLALFQCFKSSK